jgi:hypothetical protein
MLVRVGRVGIPDKAEEWQGSPLLETIAAPVAGYYRLGTADREDVIQETRIALWEKGLASEVTVSWINHTAAHKVGDLLGSVARREAREARRLRLLHPNARTSSQGKTSSWPPWIAGSAASTSCTMSKAAANGRPRGSAEPAGRPCWLDAKFRLSLGCGDSVNCAAGRALGLCKPNKH